MSADLAARSQVSEVGLDVDRAELIRRYRDEEGLNQTQIGKSIGLSQDRISQLLRYRRYNSSTTDGRSPISERRFRSYWKQVSDPKMLRGKRDKLPDNPTAKQVAAYQAHMEYEAACFADIRKLVEEDKPPLACRKWWFLAGLNCYHDDSDFLQEAEMGTARKGAFKLLGARS